MAECGHRWMAGPEQEKRPSRAGRKYAQFVEVYCKGSSNTVRLAERTSSVGR